MECLQVLLIGVDRYGPDPSVRDLFGAVADVDAMETYLLRCGVEQDAINKLVSSHDEARNRPNTEPTYENMVAAFGDLAQRAGQAAGEALVYFSGHGGRVATLIPGIKGKDGIDEGLVPSNLDNPSARFLHDVELTYLLYGMARQKVSVTVILDACHSGGMMRRRVTGTRCRGAKGVRRLVHPEPSLVASLTELERVWQQVHHRTHVRFRHSRRSTGGWTSKGLVAHGRIAIFSACRKRESAYEKDFGSGPRGVFTRNLLEILCRGPAPGSWDEIHRWLSLRLQRVSPAQWPVLEGSPSVGSFEEISRYREHPILVLEVDRAGRRVRLDVGVALGVGVGACLKIQLGREGAQESGPLVEVEEASASDVWAALREGRADLDEVEPGDEAVLVDLGIEKRRVVWLRSGRETTNSIITGRHRQIESGLSNEDAESLFRAELLKRQKSLLEPLRANQLNKSPDFLIRADGPGLEILRADETPVLGVAPFPSKSPRMIRRLARCLEHIAQFEWVRGLANHDERSDLLGCLELHIGSLPIGYKKGAPIESDEVGFSKQGPRISAGRWIVLEVGNRSKQDLHLYVLDLRPDFAISIIHPRRGLTTLEGGQQICLPFELFLPRGHPGGLEILKVIATTEPAWPKSLRLPAIDHSSIGAIPPMNSQHWLGSSGKKTWRSSRFRLAHRFWTTQQIELEVIRAPDSATED